MPETNGQQTAGPAPTLAALQRQSSLTPLESRLLLCHVSGLSRIALITHSEDRLEPSQEAAWHAAVARRVAGEPIAYILGRREFYGLMLEVDSAVLIPRSDTELLVDLALQQLPPEGSLLDMGTGSGAIAIAVAHSRSDAQVTALDVSAAALAVARRNAALHLAQRQTPVRFIESDWYAALEAGAGAAADTAPRFDLIVSNPPYIVAGDSHLSQGDLRFEPIDALTDHGDGLSAFRTIIAGAGPYLRQGGSLLMEHGYDQAAAVRLLLVQQGYAEVQSWRDLAGIERVSGGTL